MNLRGGFSADWVGSGFCHSIPAGCDLDHGTQVGTVRSGPCVVGVCGIISGAAVLAAAGWESVGGHAGEIMLLPGPSGDVLSAGRAGFGTSGSHSPVS